MITRERIDQLRSFRGGDYPVLTLYLDLPPNPVDRNSIPPRLKDLLRPIEQRAADSDVPRDGRQSLRQDMERVTGMADELRRMEARSVVIVSCSAAGWFDVLPLPIPVGDVAVVDERPYVRPLLRILDEHHRFLVIVIDRRRAWLYERYMDEIRELEKIEGDEVRKKNFAGWYGLEEHRVRNRAVEKARAHYREVAARAREVFDALSCEYLILGGQDEVVEEFAAHLTGELKSRIAGRFSVDTSTVTAARVHELCGPIEVALEEREEAELVERILSSAASGGLAAVGLRSVLPAVSAGGVDVLAVHDGFVSPGHACARCGWLSVDSGNCPWCAEPMREVPDVVETAAEQVLEDGGRVEHVRVSTPLADHGVGALLRFPPPAAGTS